MLDHGIAGAVLHRHLVEAGSIVHKDRGDDGHGAEQGLSARRREFPADIAVYPGALGSPVFVSNQNGYFDPRRQTFAAQPRLKLVGILTGGAYVTTENH